MRMDMYIHAICSYCFMYMCMAICNIECSYVLFYIQVSYCMCVCVDVCACGKHRYIHVVKWLKVHTSHEINAINYT